MNATQQKISWARRAIDEMHKAQANASRGDFQYHFGAFLALIGALRQFITVDPYKQWVYRMDEQDLNYCGCVDLRNVDVHVANVAGDARSHIDVQLGDTLPKWSDGATAAVTKAGEQPAATDAEPPSGRIEALGTPASSVTARFFVNVDTLPADFAVLPHNHQARPTKGQEVALIRATPAVEIAERALDFYESSVLPGAVSTGIPIP